MKKIICTLALLALPMQALAADFMLTSPQIKEGGTLGAEQVYNGFGCTGPNISPKLEWSNAPEGTKSFAVTAYDPDAPTGSGWWHWVVFDIPATATGIDLNASADGKLPAGAIESVTDFGTPGFGGACPPAGDKAHRYIFTVYALGVEKLGPDAKGMPAFVGFNISGNKLGEASITATYGR